MINAYISKVIDAGFECSNRDCKHNLEYFNKIFSSYFFKDEATCIIITIGGSSEIYCKDCIDIVYQKLKPVLDTKLWVLM